MENNAVYGITLFKAMNFFFYNALKLADVSL